MSNAEHYDAALVGFNGPFFSPAAKALHDWMNQGELIPLGDDRVTRYDFHKKGGVSFTRGSFQNALRDMPGYREHGSHADPVVTSDDYGWFAQATFGLKSGTVTVLIPYTQDWVEAEDGTLSDRHLAVYTQGEVHEQEVELVLAQMLARLKACQEPGEKEDAKSNSSVAGILLVLLILALILFFTSH